MAAPTALHPGMVDRYAEMCHFVRVGSGLEQHNFEHSLLEAPVISIAHAAHTLFLNFDTMNKMAMLTTSTLDAIVDMTPLAPLKTALRHTNSLFYIGKGLDYGLSTIERVIQLVNVIVEDGLLAAAKDIAALISYFFLCTASVIQLLQLCIEELQIQFLIDLCDGYMPLLSIAKDLMNAFSSCLGAVFLTFEVLQLQSRLDLLNEQYEVAGSCLAKESPDASEQEYLQFSAAANHDGIRLGHNPNLTPGAVLRDNVVCYPEYFVRSALENAINEKWALVSLLVSATAFCALSAVAKLYAGSMAAVAFDFLKVPLIVIMVTSGVTNIVYGDFCKQIETQALDRGVIVDAVRKGYQQSVLAHVEGEDG